MTALLTPIDQYLAVQQSATAVDTFARRHDAGRLDEATIGRMYADRMPLSAPAAGQQYAFRVDLDQCTGCKACVAGCHSLNGLDEGESWRTVGQLVGTDSAAPALQSAPTGCHHCVEPACLSGCPTNAYEKDPWTGIVSHLDDQCFGCGYCELTCPYEVPQMNERLGIVRKCDLCADRLAEGEAPACVQACPTGAIAIEVVDVAAVVAATATGSLLPGAPASSITSPTTRYVGGALPSGARAVDHHAVAPAHGHPPLAALLVLSQLSVGVLAASLVTSWRGVESNIGPVVASVVALAAVGASVTHLGRPLVAWRAVLGIRHSWLSREIVALGAYVGLVIAHAGLVGTGLGPSWAAPASGVAALIAGAAGVCSSVMLYAVTRRVWWRAARSARRFGATTIGLGGIAHAAAVAVAGPVGAVRDAAPTAAAATMVLAIQVACEARFVVHHRASPGIDETPTADLARTARLLTAPLRAMLRLRLALGSVGVLGGLAITAWIAAAPVAGVDTDVAVLAVIVALVATAGELVSRSLFFLASSPPRMPGGFR